MSHPLYKRLPDSLRKAIGLRRARKWLTAQRLRYRHNRSLAADAPVINFYPMLPGPKSQMTHVARRLGARIGNSPEGGMLRFAWDNGTWFSPRAARRLAPDAINRECLDISKTRVDRVWAEVAGYGITVDPTTTEGAIVEKPDINGLHAGRVVLGPIARPRRGYVYQKLIDNIQGDSRTQTRAVIIDGRMVLTYNKWRPIDSPFTNNRLSLPERPEDHYSADERELILHFARAMNLDYGDIDILRENGTGRLYAIDANRTPVLPKGLPPEKRDASLAPMVEAFRELIRSRAGG